MGSSEEKTIMISGMSCNHCKITVENALSAISGVSLVTVDLEKGSATVTGDNLSDDTLRSAVEEAGYEVTG